LSEAATLLHVRWMIAAAVLVVGPALLRGLLKKRIERTLAARLPDRIHLVPAKPSWRDRNGVASIQTELAALGFAWVGDFQVPELPDYALRLLVRVDEGVYANIQEAAGGAPWLELVTPYRDGRRAHLTTLPATGQKTPPWVVKSVHAPGATPRDAFQRMLAERPHAGIATIAPETLPRLWEDEYARIAAWRKSLHS